MELSPSTKYRRTIKATLQHEEVQRHRRFEEDIARRNTRAKWCRLKRSELLSPLNSSEPPASSSASCSVANDSPAGLFGSLTTLLERLHSASSRAGDMRTDSSFDGCSDYIEAVKDLEDFFGALRAQLEVLASHEAPASEELCTLGKQLDRVLEIGYRDLIRSSDGSTADRSLHQSLERLIISVMGVQSALEGIELQGLSDNALIIHKDIFVISCANIIGEDNWDAVNLARNRLRDILRSANPDLASHLTFDDKDTAHISDHLDYTKERVPRLSEPYKFTCHVVALLASHAEDDPDSVLRPGDPSDLLRLGAALFHNCVDAITADPIGMGDQNILQLAGQLIWLLSSILTVRNPKVARYLLLDLGTFTPIVKLIYCLSPTINLSEQDRGRSICGDALWCLNYAAMSEPRIFREILSPQNTVRGEFVTCICNVVTKCVNATLHHTTHQSSTANTDSPRGEYAVDIIAPALQILTFAALSSLPDRDVSETDHSQQSANLSSSESSTLSDSFALDTILSNKPFEDCIPRLLSHPHRGLIRDTAQLIAIAASSVFEHHTTRILRFRESLAEGFSKEHGFDVKREFAAALLHLSLNHEHRHLATVVKTEPDVVNSFLDLLTMCRQDATAVMISADFLEGVARYLPEGRFLLYKNGFVRILEGLIEDLKEGPALKRLVHIQAHYFDDVDDLCEQDDQDILE